MKSIIVLLGALSLAVSSPIIFEQQNRVARSVHGIHGGRSGYSGSHSSHSSSGHSSSSGSSSQSSMYSESHGHTSGHGISGLHSGSGGHQSGVIGSGLSNVHLTNGHLSSGLHNEHLSSGHQSSGLLSSGLANEHLLSGLHNQHLSSGHQSSGLLSSGLANGHLSSGLHNQHLSSGHQSSGLLSSGLSNGHLSSGHGQQIITGSHGIHDLSGGLSGSELIHGTGGIGSIGHGHRPGIITQTGTLGHNGGQGHIGILDGGHSGVSTIQRETIIENIGGIGTTGHGQQVITSSIGHSGGNLGQTGNLGAGLLLGSTTGGIGQGLGIGSEITDIDSLVNVHSSGNVGGLSNGGQVLHTSPLGNVGSVGSGLHGISSGLGHSGGLLQSGSQIHGSSFQGQSSSSHSQSQSEHSSMQHSGHSSSVGSLSSSSLGVVGGGHSHGQGHSQIIDTIGGGLRQQSGVSGIHGGGSIAKLVSQVVGGLGKGHGNIF